MILIDADVLGRRRTGDETYVQNLLRELPGVAPDLTFGAVTRHPELVPAGVEPIELPAGLQEARMAYSLPRLLRRVKPELAHFQHALPFGWKGRSVVTIHDLSFAGADTTMGFLDRWTFRTVVPRAARRADHVLTVSRRTKRDILARFGIAETKVTVTPNGVDPAFTPGGAHDGYVLFVGAIQQRKDPLSAQEAASSLDLPFVVVGPEKDAGLAERLRRSGADLRGYVSKESLADLYRGAAVLVLPSRYEGFGLPVVEAMACGSPVVVADEPALREVGGDAVVYIEHGDVAGAAGAAIADRERLSAAGIERAKSFSWTETARRTAEVYRQVLG